MKSCARVPCHSVSHKRRQRLPAVIIVSGSLSHTVMYSKIHRCWSHLDCQRVPRQQDLAIWSINVLPDRIPILIGPQVT
jgi:hypothetical protein